MRLFGFIPIPSLRKIIRSKWARIPLIIIGIGCIIAAIWFGLPMTGVAFLSTVWLRATLIGVILFFIFLSIILKWRKRRKAARELEDTLIPEPVGDGDVLTTHMNEALDKLKKSGGKTYLYDLPWYVIIGPPGAGKTTALRNSGIEFPGSETSEGSVEGFGGTKNCDWWFAEDAILIDTAGRYTSQDSDKEADENSWSAFLGLLKKGRPNQPINGVILAFSCEDMMTATQEDLTKHAMTVRERLGEIHKALKIDFPVYVLFTKADLISGFREYFSSFSQSRRKAVWGATFQTKDRAAQTFENVATEFDTLVSRLSDEIIDRMNEEPDSVARIAIFGLPGQMALMRDNIAEFMRRVFEPTRYKSNAILRGFYFTSGTQEGTPIDQVLGAMAQTTDSDSAFQPAFMSGRGKSFFLHDLLKKVIFEERDWVSHDERAVRRTKVLRGLALTIILLATFGAMGAFGYSFWRNTDLVRTAELEAEAYRDAAQSELRRTIVDNTDPSIVMPHLQRLRIMTAGFGNTVEPNIFEGMGLGQHRRIQVAANKSYSDALERMLRPRMILHMENVIPQLIVDDQTEEVFRALKVYILLGGQQAGPPDDEAVQAYFSRVWRSQFSSAGQIDERDQLEAHLAAMLELDDDRTPIISIDPAMVKNAQDAIVNLPLAAQAYATIKDRALNSGLRDFNVIERLAGAVEDVFETNDGTDLSTVIVPAMYTFEGYWGFFLEELTEARTRLEEDKWVLGDAAERVDFEGQLNGLERDLHRAYQIDYQQAWIEMLSRLSLASMSVDSPNYEALASTASSVASPILELVEAIDEETRLVRLYEQIESLTAADLAGGLTGGLGDAMLDRIYNRSGVFQRVILDNARDGAKDQTRAGSALEEDNQRRQVERISEQFEDWHLLLKGEQGRRPIDIILANLGAIRENRRASALAPTPQDDAVFQPLLSALTSNNTSFPPQLGGWLNEIESEFRSVAQDATMSQMNRALNDEVAQYCKQNIESSFPFGNGRPISPNTFGEFFGPGGRMDRFYSTYLQQHVTRTTDGMQPLPSSPLAERLNPTALRQFEQAEAIRAAFFASGSALPEVAMFVTHTSSSPSVSLANLTINGGRLQSQPNGTPGTIAWPGQGSGASIQLFLQDGRNVTRNFDDGRWAIVDFLRKGRTRRDGSEVEVTHEVSGLSITYKIIFDSNTVPFLMSELSDFSCPTSLE